MDAVSKISGGLPALGDLTLSSPRAALHFMTRRSEAPLGTEAAVKVIQREREEDLLKIGQVRVTVSVTPCVNVIFIVNHGLSK